MRNIFTFVFGLALLSGLTACEKSTPQPDSAAMANASGNYRTCAACHGATGLGNPALQAPALVNLDEDYLQRQINNFRNGVRGRHPKDTWGQQMSDQASLLKDDNDVASVVTQIRGFDNQTPAPTFEADLNKGQGLYNATCGACHGPEGSGNPVFHAPSLRGMDDWYLARQYENFRDGVRGTHEDDEYGRQMQRMGHVLKSEDDIQAVAAWLLSLGVDD